MTRYGMAIDIDKCVGCYNCFLTCRDEYAGNDYPGYSAAQPMSGGNWIKVNEIERGQYPHVKVDYVPVTCSHCDSAACVKLDQTGAIYRRADGIVLIDPEKAKGNKELVKTCPYRRIEWNEELQLAQKCTFCAHLLDEGEPEPRCVESCPTGALVFGDLDDPASAVATTGGRRRHRGPASRIRHGREGHLPEPAQEVRGRHRHLRRHGRSGHRTSTWPSAATARP